MKKSLKEKALVLRKSGWSYNIISQRLGISKSTLCNWLKDVPYKPNEEVAQRIKNGPVKSAIKRHNQKIEAIKHAKKIAASEVGQITERDLFMLGVGLYIGEGSKVYETVRIINSEPEVIKLAMNWFRVACGLKTDNFSIAIHLYPDTPKKEALKFWSSLTGIPIKQFGKTQIDTRDNKSRKKRRQLAHGTAHITIRCNGEKNKGVFLHRKIMGWIEEIYKQMRV